MGDKLSFTITKVLEIFKTIHHNPELYTVNEVVQFYKHFGHGLLEYIFTQEQSVFEDCQEEYDIVLNNTYNLLKFEDFVAKFPNTGLEDFLYVKQLSSSGPFELTLKDRQVLELLLQ